MITIIFLVLLVLYLGKILLFRTGAQRATITTDCGGEPEVTVIVAARNEEGKIARCLESLSKLDYPDEKFEILVIDDESTDRTSEIIADYEKSVPPLHALKTRGVVHGLRGKANAVSQVIERSRGEIIFTTDADCVVPRNWIRETLRSYTPGTGCVCGFTVLHTTGFFSGMQSLDWTYLLTIASAGVGWGYPLSAVGNNMSFRRKAYDDVGGYAGVGFSVTEDFVLFKAIGYKTKWKVRYPVSKETLVWSEPCQNVKELYQQKKRWGKGGVDIHPLGFAIMSVGFLMNAAILVAPLLSIPLPYWLFGIAAKCAGDAFLLHFPLKRFGQLHLFKYFPMYELYYLMYVTVLPFLVLFGGRVVWKERKL